VFVAVLVGVDVFVGEFVGVTVGVAVGLGVGVRVKKITEVPVKTEADASITLRRYSFELSYGAGISKTYGKSPVVILDI
jgi:hypothetical protein